MGQFAAQMKHSKDLIVSMIIAMLLFSSCGRNAGDKLVGEWVNKDFKAQTMTISKNGETYIVELRNSQLPELNQKFAARYKDNVIYLQGTQTQLFYDERADRISGVFGLGRNEFRRK